MKKTKSGEESEEARDGKGDEANKEQPAQETTCENVEPPKKKKKKKKKEEKD